MKIITRAELVKMPQGTVFAKWQPCVFEELEWFDEAVASGKDYRSCVLTSGLESEDRDRLCDEPGASVAVDLMLSTRDGCFDDAQLYALWEADDIRRLIAHLQDCLEAAYEEKPRT